MSPCVHLPGFPKFDRHAYFEKHDWICLSGFPEDWPSGDLDGGKGHDFRESRFSAGHPEVAEPSRFGPCFGPFVGPFGAGSASVGFRFRSVATMSSFKHAGLNGFRACECEFGLKRLRLTYVLCCSWLLVSIGGLKRLTP